MSYVGVSDRANNSCLVEIDEGDTVADLKKKIAVKLKVRNRHQILTYEGIEMENHALVSTYNFSAECSIALFNSTTDFRARLDLSPQANINRAGNFFCSLASGQYEALMEDIIATNLRVRHNAYGGETNATTIYGEYFGHEGLLQWLTAIKAAYTVTSAPRTSSFAGASDFVFCEYEAIVKVTKTHKRCRIARTIKLTFDSQGKLMLLDIVEDPTAYLTALEPIKYTGPTGQPYTSKQDLITNALTFEGQNGLTLVRAPGTICGNPFFLKSLKKCKVVLADHTEQVLIDDLEECQVLIGVSCSTVWVRNCKNCQFNVACQQLRVSSSSHCDFTLFSAMAPILDGSHHIDVRPFQHTYALQYKHFKAADIDKTQNNWSKIEDQDAVNPAVPYPRFTIKKEEGESWDLEEAWTTEHEVPLHAKVEARYHGKARYFRGQVSKVNTGADKKSTYNIVYVDGDTEKNVAREYIRVISLPPK